MKICRHDVKKNWSGLAMFRCSCGNLWIEEKFFGSVPPEQGALAIFAAFKRGSANELHPQSR